MTVIAGLVATDGTVYMGADSAGIVADTLHLHVRADAKVFVNGGMLFGFAGSYRVGQILRYGLTVPPVDDADISRYMVTAFIDAVRTILRGKGALGDHTELLIGTHGRLFSIGDDYQVGESHDEFVAIGCGAPVAHGALHASRGLGLTPRTRIRRALTAAEQYSGGVRRPFVIRRLAPA